MNCKNCGNPLVGGEKFCKNCGVKIEEATVNEPTVVEPVQQTVQPSNNKGSDKKNFIILTVIVIILALGFAVGYLLMNKDKDNNSEDDNKTKTTETKKDTSKTDDIDIDDIDLDDIDLDDDIDDTDTTDSEDTYTYKNFKFNKVEGFTYTTSSQGLQITNLSDVIVLDAVAGDFDIVKKNTSTVETTFKNQGYDIKNVEVKTYGGVEYITSEVTKDSISMLILYTKADNNHTFVIGVTNTKFTVDYDVITTVNKIIKDAKYVG